MRSVPFFLLLILLASCGISEKEAVVRPLIMVGDTEISREDFERTYVARLISAGENDTRRSRWLHLANLIDAELLSQEARRRGLTKDSLGSRKIETIRRKTTADTYFERAFLDRLEPPSDDEIRRAFARWKEKAVVRHLFYRDSTQAVEGYNRLVSGVPFLDEAQRCYRTSSYDSSAGYLGPVGYFEMDDAFAEAAFSLARNEFSRPVRSRFGYHIILLEDKLLSPLLTETEFQMRREGISSKWRLRKRRLEGDRFVRSFMQGLAVRVNESAIRSLSEMIQLIERRVAAVNPRFQFDETPAEPVPDISSSTILARYTFQGEDRIFTLDDYAAWFDDLPFPEARHRTAASVGRALRNEVFALAGEAEGLDTDPVTLNEIAFQERIYLAGRMRNLLREKALESSESKQISIAEDESTGTVEEVRDRETVDVSERSGVSRDRITALVAERQLLERLRAQTHVQVDSALFDAMWNLEPSE